MNTSPLMKYSTEYFHVLVHFHNLIRDLVIPSLLMFKVLDCIYFYCIYINVLNECMSIQHMHEIL